MSKICAISDTHGHLPEIGKCDYLFICGDIFPLYIQRNNEDCKTWFTNEFFEWVRKTPCEKILLVAGNHDFFFERHANKIKSLIDEGGLSDKLIYLKDELYTLPDGKTVYGCPWCSGPQGWAFVDTTENHYKNIPDCDILLTHQPARVKTLGTSYPGTAWQENFGSSHLYEEIIKKKISYAFCGHIHSGTHGGVVSELCDTKFYNVSLKDEDYIVNYKPTYLEIE